MIIVYSVLAVMVIIASAGFLAGKVAEGHQAVRFRFGRRVPNDRLFDEGLHWIMPIAESLKQFKLQTVTAALRDFDVQTGTYVNARVSVSCEWRIDPDNIYSYSSGPDVIRALEGTLKEVTAVYFRYLSSVDDMYNAAMVSHYSDVLFAAVRQRVLGERPVLRGPTWSSVEVHSERDVFSRLGVQITGLNVHQIEFPNLVRDAQQRNLASSIDAQTVRETSVASADAVARMAQAGATADIALLQNERILAPHIKRTEVPEQQNILIQNPNSGGAPLVGGYLTSSVKVRTNNGSDNGVEEATPKEE